MPATPEIVIVVYRPEPREPSILETMTIIGFFMRYGARASTPGSNLLKYQLVGMPELVNAYWLWMHNRPWD